jgi:hypothetical protein
MAKMKYKVGDKVRVKSDLVNGKYYENEANHVGIYFNKDMMEYRGKIVTISQVVHGSGVYRIKEDGRTWAWSIGMFEEVEKPEVVEINGSALTGVYVTKVIYNNPATIVFYHRVDVENNRPKIDRSKVYKSVAICKEGDVYDKQKGLEVALLKATIKECTKKLKKY